MKSTQTTQTAHHRPVTGNRLCGYSAAQHSSHAANGELSLTGTENSNSSTTPLTAEALGEPAAAQPGGGGFGVPFSSSGPHTVLSTLTDTSRDDHTSPMHQTLPVLNASAGGTEFPPAPTAPIQACITPKPPGRARARAGCSSSVSNTKPGLEHLPRVPQHRGKLEFNSRHRHIPMPSTQLGYGTLQ